MYRLLRNRTGIGDLTLLQRKSNDFLCNKKGDDFMFKQIAWNTFKKTGNINTFMEFKQLRDLEKKIEEEKNGNNKDKRNYIS